MDARLIRHRGLVRQRGVVLFVALIVIVAMALAGLALVRSVDTNVIVAGNIAFKQGATNAADQGLEVARTWLLNNKSTLSDDQAVGTSYIANWQSTVDLTGNDPSKTDFDWNANGYEVTANDGAGNRVRYVIHRMCADSNKTPSATTCVTVASTSGAGSSKSGQYSGRRGYEDGGGAGGGGGFGTGLGGGTVYYRITVRVDGPRNTVSYVQGLMY